MACEDKVCALDAFCCDIGWDNLCVDGALAICGFSLVEAENTELCWPVVAANGEVVINCLGNDVLYPSHVNPIYNQPPNVNAGNNKTITLPDNSVSFTAGVSDDGLPAPASLTYSWTKTVGFDVGVNISNPSSISTNVSFTKSDTYTFKLTVDDGELSGSDTVQVTVNPVAEASSDLIVDSVSVTDSTPETGQSFTIKATVRNQGTTSSATDTTLLYRRSTDSNITAADTQIGTDPVPILSAGNSSPETISVSIGTPGTYWVGGCVDEVAGESPTNNQCSTGVQVTVSDTPVNPDLIVDSVSVTNSTPETDQSFTINAKVRNQGAGSSAGTTLRYRRSTDSTINGSDTAFGEDTVVGLSPGNFESHSISRTISNPGTYWVGGCVDSVAGESPTNNQCSTGVQVTVSCGTGERDVGGVCKIIITNAGQCSNVPTTNNNHDVRSPNCSNCHAGRSCEVPPGYVYP